MRRGGYGYGRGGQQPRGRLAMIRRLWPIALAAWRRWDNLTPQEKERYRRMAADYAQRGRKAIDARRSRRGR